MAVVCAKELTHSLIQQFPESRVHNRISRHIAFLKIPVHEVLAVDASAPTGLKAARYPRYRTAVASRKRFRIEPRKALASFASIENAD